MKFGIFFVYLMIAIIGLIGGGLIGLTALSKMHWFMLPFSAVLMFGGYQSAKIVLGFKEATNTSS